ncbi:Ran-binding protein 1-c-like protein [Morus notabilis]|uniref:Ran-binding protein 1-c-like protein n=1 Tax=Morus notabilis TaxID=981085 RepID=W9QRV8_9ROSA|nr:Ran-binding protein 1-c-like protein [Morus notabilis]
MSSSGDPERREEEEETPPVEDEDTGAPFVKLEEEDAVLDPQAKLYRYDKGENQWKERGVGNVKLLKHNESGTVLVLNHIYPTMNVQEHSGNHKSCVWHASDFEDGELKDDIFCIIFASVARDKGFELEYDVWRSNTELKFFL